MSHALALAKERGRPAGILAFSGFVPRVEGSTWRRAATFPSRVTHGALDPIILLSEGRRRTPLLCAGTAASGVSIRRSISGSPRAASSSNHATVVHRAARRAGSRARFATLTRRNAQEPVKGRYRCCRRRSRDGEHLPKQSTCRRLKASRGWERTGAFAVARTCRARMRNSGQPGT